MRHTTPLEPSKFYHVYNRGNNRENIFLEERNYPYFLKLYTHHISPIADAYAYCLMRNHFHLLIRVKSEGALKKSDFSKKSDFYDPTIPTRAFQSLFIAYAKAINKGYSRTGKLFQEHFSRIEVTSDNYFINLIFYIHFNPQKHGFVKDFRDWKWSSYGAMMSDGPTNLQRAATLAWFDGRERFEQFHQGAVDERMIAPLIEDDFD